MVVRAEYSSLLPSAGKLAVPSVIIALSSHHGRVVCPPRHNPRVLIGASPSAPQSSRGLLLWFSREHLCGEGDITRHLHHLGYRVSHVQRPAEEYDYAVGSLARDLRDGIRLT